jgi:hypothetical protein
MSDPLTEDVILPGTATGLFPRQPNGKKIHVSVIYRYMKHGCRGVILESVRTPRLATSRQAIARFFQRLSEPAQPTGLLVSTPAARERENRNVEQELDWLGI